MIVTQCVEASFRLMGEDELECIEGVETFKYLGRMLDRLDDDWPAVLRNVGKALRLWIGLGKLLRSEGTDPQVSAMLYWAVVQAVLLFGAETWVLLAAMYWNLEGVHMVFLRKMTG